MIVCPTVRKQDIRSHYNLTTLFYRLLWGRHIHHGLWSGNETATVAQQQLTETLAREAGIQRGEQVLDVGCGMGSSSIYLASQLDCQVTGVTISSVQRRWAEWAARWHHVAGQSRFLCRRRTSGLCPPLVRRGVERRVHGAPVRKSEILSPRLHLVKAGRAGRDLCLARR